MSADEKPSARSSLLGCVLAGAVGDALGAPVEFMLRTDRRFGPDGITNFAEPYLFI